MTLEPSATSGDRAARERIAAVILGAGKGARMKSRTPKVLHRIGNRPMVLFALDAARAAGAGTCVVVAGPDMAGVAEAVAPVPTVVQAKPNGTADAVRPARGALGQGADAVLILYGDTPFIRPQTLETMIDLVRDLADLKLLTQSASSEFTERLVCEVIDQGHYRKFRSRLLAKLQKARIAAVRRLESFGFGPAADGTHGLYAWLDVPGVADTTALAEAAVKRKILLAPGALFRPNMEKSTKMRFNVAFCQNDGLFRELEALLNAEIRPCSR